MEGCGGGKPPPHFPLMEVLVQWATDPPRPFVAIDATQWATLPTKYDPVSEEELLDEVEGWICAIKVDGVQYNGHDHYHVKDHGNGVVILTFWNDNPRDFGGCNYYAYVFHLPNRIEVRYAQQNARIKNVTKPWEEFIYPPHEETRHGKWMENEMFDMHMRLIR